jgi:hypothetical protein
MDRLRVVTTVLPLGKVVVGAATSMMMDALLNHLATTPPGPITDASTLARLLADAWGELSGDHGGIIPAKHLQRMEDVTWNPPLLTFVIERHGGTVLGSTRATVQQWTVDVEQGSVACVEARHRKLRPMQARLDVASIAEDIVAQIVLGRDDHRLHWGNDGRVRVVVSKVLPEGSAVKQTLAARRKRLRAALKERLVPLGWHQCRANVYERQA